MTKSKKIYSMLSTGIVLGAMVLAPFGAVGTAFADTATVTVTISKFIDGQMATAQSANSADFSMSATWNADNIGSGTGTYTLSATAPTPYQTMTTDMTSGADYSTNEVLDGTLVGADCSANPTYTLAGYTTGTTMAEAMAATPTATAPNFTGMTGNEFVIVWNTTCAPVTPTTLKVHIMGYLDGSETTAASANNYLFPMSATWQTANLNGGAQGTGTYTLGNGSDSSHLYATDTADYDAPASYSTNEITNDTDNTSLVLPIGAACVDGDYSLQGYKTSTVSFADAATQTLSTTAPSFTNINADQYVLVYDTTCGQSSGTIGGSVNGGLDPDTLAVTSITTDNATATADGTFEHGWKYTFHITVPSTESHLSMKFGDWMNNANSSQVAAANNIRISSAQADNNGETILITAANTYPTTSLNMTGDLDANTPGKQVDVVVETAVPVNSINGTYTTSYGVQTLP